MPRVDTAVGGHVLQGQAEGDDHPELANYSERSANRLAKTDETSPAHLRTEMTRPFSPNPRTL
jgi:hypothetical protein